MFISKRITKGGEWCGAVWRGVVWYGMVWYGTYFFLILEMAGVMGVNDYSSRFFFCLSFFLRS